MILLLVLNDKKSSCVCSNIIIWGSHTSRRDQDALRIAVCFKWWIVIESWSQWIFTALECFQEAQRLMMIVLLRLWVLCLVWIIKDSSCQKYSSEMFTGCFVFHFKYAELTVVHLHWSGSRRWTWSLHVDRAAKYCPHLTLERI